MEGNWEDLIYDIKDSYRHYNKETKNDDDNDDEEEEHI